MKVKVVKRFNDRVTHERRNPEEVHDYSEERAQELIKNGFVIAVKEKEEKKA